MVHGTSVVNSPHEQVRATSPRLADDANIDAI